MIHVDAVVLAAGMSSRMGTPKMLLPWGEGTVLSTVVSCLLQLPVDRVAVVTGHWAAETASALGPLVENPRVLLCHNERYQEGMLTSVQCGVRALGAHGNVLVALGDQPLVTAEAVGQVLSAHAGGLTVPLYGGRQGHPVCVDASLVAPLLSLPADVGMRALFQAYPDRVVRTPVTSGGVLIDLDTPADYDKHRPAGGKPRE